MVDKKLPMIFGLDPCSGLRNFKWLTDETTVDNGRRKDPRATRVHVALTQSNKPTNTSMGMLRL